MDAGAILTSTAVAAVVSGVMSALYNLHAKQRDFVNEYYRTVLQRRISAYELLEELITSIKTAVFDTDDNKPYHLLFSQDDNWHCACELLTKIMPQALWLSAEAFEKTKEFSYLIFRLKPDVSAIAFGKENYQKIVELREGLERILANDLLSLHDVKRFLQQKRNVESGLRTVTLRR